jgi:hypothetical protein
MRLGRWISTAWLALASLCSTTVAVEYLTHTDDGCVVEVHCLACRTAVSRAATKTATVAVPEPRDIVEIIAPATAPSALTVSAPATDSRGPPLT